MHDALLDLVLLDYALPRPARHSLCTYCNFTKYRSGREDTARLSAAYTRALERTLDDLVRSLAGMRRLCARTHRPLNMADCPTGRRRGAAAAVGLFRWRDAFARAGEGPGAPRPPPVPATGLIPPP